MRLFYNLQTKTSPLRCRHHHPDEISRALLTPRAAPGKFREGADASDEGANYIGTRALKPDRS